MSKKTRLLSATEADTTSITPTRPARAAQPSAAQAATPETPAHEALALYEQTTRRIAKLVGRLDCGFAVRVLSGAKAGSVFPIPKTYPIVLGREGDADVILADSSVSRRHTLLSWVGHALWAQDLGSSNGTVVNGRPLKSAQLSAGDRLKLGETEVVIELVDASSACPNFFGEEAEQPLPPVDLLHMPAEASRETLELLKAMVDELAPKLAALDGRAASGSDWDGAPSADAEGEIAYLKHRVAELKRQGTRVFEAQRKEIERLWAEIDRARTTIKDLERELAELRGTDA